MLFYFNLFASPLLLPTKVYTLYTFNPESSFRIHKKTRLRIHIQTKNKKSSSFALRTNEGVGNCFERRFELLFHVQHK